MKQFLPSSFDFLTLKLTDQFRLNLYHQRMESSNFKLDFIQTMDSMFPEFDLERKLLKLSLFSFWFAECAPHHNICYLNEYDLKELLVYSYDSFWHFEHSNYRFLNFQFTL